jgi:hypothetical protein
MFDGGGETAAAPLTEAAGAVSVTERWVMPGAP